jgi:hypothetical protein
MADSILLNIDFSDVEPVNQTQRGYPESGTQKATIRTYMEYETDDGSSTLYCNMTTGNIDHRERWNTGNEWGKRFLMTHFINAGVPLDVLKSGKKLPLDKLKGREVYFNYTRPNVLPDGTAAQGSYPKYKWISKDEYDATLAAPTQAAAAVEESVSKGEFVVETKTEDAPAVTPTADAGDLGWLTN